MIFLAAGGGGVFGGGDLAIFLAAGGGDFGGGGGMVFLAASGEGDREVEGLAAAVRLAAVFLGSIVSRTLSAVLLICSSALLTGAGAAAAPAFSFPGLLVAGDVGALLALPGLFVALPASPCRFVAGAAGLGGSVFFEPLSVEASGEGDREVEGLAAVRGFLGSVFSRTLSAVLLIFSSALLTGAGAAAALAFSFPGLLASGEVDLPARALSFPALPVAFVFSFPGLLASGELDLLVRAPAFPALPAASAFSFLVGFASFPFFCAAASLFAFCSGFCFSCGDGSGSVFCRTSSAVLLMFCSASSRAPRRWFVGAGGARVGADAGGGGATLPPLF